MDEYSSGEDLIVKTRKPYTITKQRERWTEDEHNRFLEALKLHGRAWQRIEEHIGTKTAVQIRSHAQKFFSKLEKEALVKGIPVAQAIDIQIPPPRPKRKPSTPYPRKTGSVSISLVNPKDRCQVIPTSSCQTKQVLDLEKDPFPEKSGGNGADENKEEKNGTVVCSQGFTPYQEVSSENRSSVSDGERVRGLCRFLPVKNSLNRDNTDESRGTTVARGNHMSCDVVATNDVQHYGAENETHGTQKYPIQLPVQALDGTPRTCTSSQVPSSDVSYQESGFHQVGGIPPHHASLKDPVMESQSSTSRADNQQHKFPSFHPPFAAPFSGTHEEFCSLLNMSSVFSSLIIATLQQNPAAHAAATYAASFWPTGINTNIQDSAATTTGPFGGIPNRQINSPASLSAIVAATVAAATAWWAAHGLLPFYAPYHGGFTCSPGFGAMDVSPKTGKPSGTIANKDRVDYNTRLCAEKLMQKSDQIFSEALAQKSASPFDSSDSMGPKIMEGITPTTDGHEKKRIGDEVEPNESNKSKNNTNNQNRKQVDRSSCGSNSSSDVETDALEKKHDKGKVEVLEVIGQPDPNQETAAGDSGSRRNRNSCNSGDSWKEVSDEGRVAFQALFLRDFLPQSFSPPRDDKNKENNKSSGKEIAQTLKESNGYISMLDLNSDTMDSCSSHLGTDAVSAGNKAAGSGQKELGPLSIGLAQERLKLRRTGFKPYKRCSMEARETRVANASSQDQEKGTKRLRLEGEAST